MERLAAANGAKWVEFDVSFTSDGTAVAFHDDTVDRITDGEGAVTSLTFSQVISEKETAFLKSAQINLFSAEQA